MKKRWLKVWAFWMMILFPMIGFADESKPVQMEEMVVTASKIPKTQGNVTQKVEVITQNEIEFRMVGKENLAEALTLEAGTSVSVLSRNDANWGTYGGIGPKYSTWLLDGLPIDSFVDTQSIDVWAFDRIETQRGPASVLYPNYLTMDFAGNQSPLAGTTNIILKDRIDKPMTQFSADYGSYDTLTLRAYHQNRAGNLHVFMGGSYEQSDYTNYGSENSWLNMIDDPEYKKTKLYLRPVFYFNDKTDHRLALFLHRTTHEGDAGRPNRDYHHKYNTINADYSLPFTEKLRMQIKMGFRNNERTWEEDNYSKDKPDTSLKSEDGVEQEILPADITFSFEHGNGSLLTFGGDFQSVSYETWSESGSKAKGNDANSKQYGVFVQEELAWDKLIFRIGGRYAYVGHEIDLLGGEIPGDDSPSWDRFLYSAGLKYHPLDTLSLYANVGTSFMAPGLKSAGGTLKLTDRGVAGKNGQLPNPNLKPEKGMGTDMGADFQITPNQKLGIRCFWNQVDDAIVENRVSEDPSQSQSVNAGETTSYGTEIEYRIRFLPYTEFFANYTYTHSEIQNDLDPDQDGAEVPFVPKHTGNIGINLTLPYDFTVGIYLHLAGKIYDSSSLSGRNEFDSYEILNMKINKVLVKNDHYSLNAYLDLYNITNNEFEMPWQFQDPGFSASGGIKVVF